MLYLKIENPVNNTISSEFWTIWGSSTKREVKDEDKRIIGQFGSGGNHAVALCLRQGINPVIFNENQKLEFFTQPIQLNSLTGTNTQHQVGVNFSGKDNKGKVIKKREILNHTLSFGSMDWTDISFSLREFISNAIDACYIQGLDHSGVTIEIVQENQIRAKSGTVRVFLPLTPAVQGFFNQIGSWFLHFSNPELLEKNVFPRRFKNLSNNKNGSMIYRRGVLVCETSAEEEGLFDYNVDDINMNESRSVDTWVAASKVGDCIAYHASKSEIIKLISSFQSDKKYWEHTISSYCYSKYQTDERKSVWVNSWNSYYGENAVVANEMTARMCNDKGYKTVKVPNNLLDFMKSTGIKNDTDVLTNTEMEGKKITDPSVDFVEATKFVWDKLKSLNLVNERELPEIKGFDINQTDNTIVFGFWQKDIVHYNNMMKNGRNEMLLHTVIEELTHHITKADDGSRDFQNYLIKVIAQTLFSDFCK